MTVALHVEVLLFARLRELAGTRSMGVDLHAPATAADAWRAVCAAHPRLEGAGSATRVAVDEEYAGWDTELRDGSVLAFIPPVAGGSVGTAPPVHVRLGPAPLDARETEALVRSDADGAVCTFTGVVRDHHQGRSVTGLAYEAYGSMAEAQMRRIGEEALSRTGATAIALHHRVGALGIGEASVVVSASAQHRAAAFDACRYGIDTLKREVPIWKRERGTGGEVWVEEAGQRG